MDADAGTVPAAGGADAPGGAQAAAPDRTWPAAGLTVVSFHNNHLVYALTWYGLALMVAGAAAYLFRDERRVRLQHAARRAAGDGDSGSADAARD